MMMDSKLQNFRVMKDDSIDTFSNTTQIRSTSDESPRYDDDDRC